jgi:hypothetical protein
VANVFGYILSSRYRGGRGGVDDIIKITFWVKDPASQRAALNAEWVKMFRTRRPGRPAIP